MSWNEEVAKLRAHLQRLAAEADVALCERYTLQPLPPERRNAYRRLRSRIGEILRRWRLRPALPQQPWLPGLKHVGHDETARPVLIWALGADRETVRAACLRFEERRMAADFVPVLVTDVADFAFYSRLGWLVEFVPTLAAPAADYGARKQRYLAWRYRDVRALPISAGLEDAARLTELLTV